MPNRIIFFIAISLLFPFPFIKAQDTNPCGVKAIMFPAGDSILAVPSSILFENASINATDYKFIYGQIEHSLNQPLYHSIEPGLNIVKLVAYNGGCTDTAVTHFFTAGKFPSATDNPRRHYGIQRRALEMTGLTGAKDDGKYIYGHRVASTFWNEPKQGLLIKSKQEGCVEWSIKLTDISPSDITKVRESADGGLYLLAEAEYRRPIVKLDSLGNKLWARTLSTEYGIITHNLVPLPDGEAAVLAFHTPTQTLVLARFSADGQLVWQKVYDHDIVSYDYFTSIEYKDGYLYIGGNIYFDGWTGYHSIISKVNLQTAATIWTRTYHSPTGFFSITDIMDLDSVLLVNITTPTGIPNKPVVGGYMRIDTSGQVISTSLLAENYTPNTLAGPYAVGSTQIIRSGKSFYLISAGSFPLSLQPGIAYYTKLARLDSNFQVQWVLRSGGAGVPRFFHSAPAPNEGVAIGGEESGTGLTTASFFSTAFSVKIIDSSAGNPDASCYFGKQEFEVMDIPISTQPMKWRSDKNGSFDLVTPELKIFPFYPQMRFKCPDYVDSCSYLEISGPTSVCNLNQTYTFNTHKNKSCGQPTKWEIPSDVQIIDQSDNSLSVKFPEFGRYVIYATNTLSCIPVQDSIVIIAESRTPPLDLGPDLQLCPNNTITLRAGPKFFSYLWPDGSSDSLFTVSQPGKYWVTVMDSCSNILSDTITITQAPPIPFSVGPDRSKCNNDTIQIQAPSGFINYKWSPAYNIIRANSRNVILNPLVDTTYTIIAEKTPGCFAYDTVSIKVFHSPVINLGPDLKFCQGDSAILDAGGFFDQYVWNTGLNARQAVVYQPGEYSVTGITTEGCKSYDTVRVLQVFPLPQPQLDQNPVICENDIRLLDAGAGYVSYLWNDGSVTQTISVKTTGTYSVKVVDQNGCEGSATTNILRIQALPTNFLFPDTAICNYGKITLELLRPYDSYLWNNGSTQPAITVNQPGTYWLTVRDNENCSATDTVYVRPKDCLSGLYVPTAFTPNGDGKNDIFRPMLFGDVERFHFAIYNRWGTLIFQTRTHGQGWDGYYANKLQDNQVYAWICTYQLAGQPQRVEKGTVLLVK